MAKLEIGQPAPDFKAVDLKNKPFCLTDYRDKAHVMLVLNRGFS